MSVREVLMTIEIHLCINRRGALVDCKPPEPIDIKVPNTGQAGNPFTNWTPSNTSFGGGGSVSSSSFNPNIPIPPTVHIPSGFSGGGGSYSTYSSHEAAIIQARNANIMKGFTGQVLGGASHEKRHCREYNEAPQVNKEMLAAARKIDGEGSSKSVNFMLFHNHCLNDDDMYWLASIFNTHTPKGLAVNTVDLSNNCLTLVRDPNLTYQDLPFFSFNSPYNTPRNILRLDLSNNQIGDAGAKVIADALACGVLPITKQINLSGNKITSNGESFIVKAMQSSTVQDIIVLTQRLNDNCKLLPLPGIATKEEKIAELKKFIQLGKAKGTYDEAVVVDKSFWGEIKNTKNSFITAYKAGIGFSKCHFVPEDMVTGYAQDKIVAKLPKLVNGVYKYATKLTNVKDIVTCYLGATDEAYSSEPGLSVVKHELCVMGEQEFCGD